MFITCCNRAIDSTCQIPPGNSPLCCQTQSAVRLAVYASKMSLCLKESKPDWPSASNLPPISQHYFHSIFLCVLTWYHTYPFMHVPPTESTSLSHLLRRYIECYMSVFCISSSLWTVKIASWGHDYLFGLSPLLHLHLWHWGHFRSPGHVTREHEM